MKSKPLWKIAITTSLEAEDAVTEMLGNLFNGTAAAYFNVETDVSIVTAFSPAKIPDVTRREVARNIETISRCGLNIGSGKVQVARVKREDWAESWKRHFKPMPVGKALLIKPSWSKQKPVKGQAMVVLDPGLSFGTGQHPTTSFCLREIVRCRKSGMTQSFLDIGTGSGILAIAAVKLGYAPVDAFDFDPEAVRIAQENAAKNRVSAKAKIMRGDITKLPLSPSRQYDLVCANLISNLLIEEGQRIVNRVKKGGTLVLAGILKSEFVQVQAAFEKFGLKRVAAKAEKEWMSGSFRLV